MSRIFITGSSEGLGLMAGQLLVEQGHQVVLHARNADRAEAACRALLKGGGHGRRRCDDDQGRPLGRGASHSVGLAP